VAQVPGATLIWLKRAPANDKVLWQVSHACLVGMCVAGMAAAVMRWLPLAWQLEHWVGVPLKTPWTWHDSHRTFR
jgi:hypothetical protein